MSNASSPQALPGDVLHRKARRWALIALVALFITLPCVVFIKPLLLQLSSLGSGALLSALVGWSLIIAAGPVVILAAGLTALFLRVEAIFSPRTGNHPKGDALTIGSAVLVSFTPALAALYPPAKAILTGYIAFRGAGQQYPLADDPHGYWQAIASWLMGAAALAFLAVSYWRAKWRSYKAQR